MLEKYINHEERTAAWKHRDWAAICYWSDEHDCFILQTTDRPLIGSECFEALVSCMP